MARIAMSVGVALMIGYVVLRQIRSEGIQLPDVLEAIAMAATPLLLPGALAMVAKALGGGALPIFNGPDDRIALFLGGAAVTSAITYVDFLALHRAWKNERA